jgi:ATP-dependent RNA helicase DeaD
MKSPPTETPPADAVPFSDLGLSEQVLRAVKTIGYESASPIQAAIPALLEGADIMGRAPDRHRQDGRLCIAHPVADRTQAA